MRQIATALPASVPGCGHDGHRPHLVATHGSPAGARVGVHMPTSWHIECCRCQCATVPTLSRAMAESRWTDPARTHHIPLSHLPRARERLAAALLVAAA
ncbi:hypothetical protein [Xanthomonas sp. XNM01]|uniref:hypothetical protein n=1 Tax=Xanthomonas sp. XNM01 TaxID=2769289 RepID=UPI00177BB126|nr:hypothetical protein [Xanthomonas sp. XNM01]MBD9368825.1 hypothetical protein [Xanthomonas sp. XNM01]